MSERVLLTSADNPIYHNPCPTDSQDTLRQQEWKGKVLLEYYESGQYRLWEGGQPKNELARYVLVWDGNSPRSIMDGMWTEDGRCVDAVLAPGTKEETREAFRSWVAANPSVSFGKESLDIDRDVAVIPSEKSVEKAQEEMGTLFDSYLNDLVS
jgi:hypothetical protein